MQDSGYGQAHGKIILAGEHAVVYGHPAIALPFREAVIQALLERKTGAFVLDTPLFVGDLQEMPSQLASVARAIDVAAAATGTILSDLQLTITSTIPDERGMGSSAAAAAAVIRAFFDLAGQALPRPELLAMVNEAEKVAHGNPSGLDAYTTTSDQAVYFVRDHEAEELTLDLDAYLLIGDTGIKSDTKGAVGAIANELQARNTEFANLLVDIGKHVEACRLAIELQSVTALAEHMQAIQSHLELLGVSSEALNKAIVAALHNGALAAKLTGGGRGGCMIALFTDFEAAIRCGQTLVSDGLITDYWTTSLQTKEASHD